ncbi:MAG TPA: hypothetical protein VF622_13120 [Segetibacter sp.]
MKKLIFSLLAIAGFYVSGNAQATSSANHTVSLALQNQIEVTFTAGAAGPTMTFSTADNYTNGVTADNAATLQVRSNKAYNVSVKAAAANFTGPAGNTMPASVLQVKESAQTTYVALSSTDQGLLSNQARGTNSFGVSYKATPGFAYDGGTYTLNVVYTATQQ